MKVVNQSYEIMNIMLNTENLIDEDKIKELKKFILVVEDCMPRMILSSDELKECNDLLKVFEDKIKELSV